MIQESKALHRLCRQRGAYDSKRVNRCPLIYCLIHTEGERAAIKLVNETYWEMLTERIKENKFYKYPWYWVYKKDIYNECKYTVAAKEDMPTHTANMEWIDVDICKKTTKLIDLGRRR